MKTVRGVSVLHSFGKLKFMPENKAMKADLSEWNHNVYQVT